MKFKIIDSIETVLEEKRVKEFDRIFVFGVFQGDENNFLGNKNFKKLDSIYKRIKQLDFKAKKGKNIIIESPVYSLIYGLDKKDKFNYDSLRNFISGSSKIAKTNKIKETIFIIPELHRELLYKERAILFIGLHCGRSRIRSIRI
ncbi:MAG: hypothetical protein M1276_06480 [Deltaproteobacteria bacterium]|nr:hypothetical protein [Deltaproteobacteria bacterium]